MSDQPNLTEVRDNLQQLVINSTYINTITLDSIPTESLQTWFLTALFL